MTKLHETLQNIKSGKSKRIRGVKVTAESGNAFEIGGNVYDLEEAVVQLEQRSTSTALQYDELAFIVMQGHKVISTHQLQNKAEHTKLLQHVIINGYHLYYSTVEKRDGKFYAKQPLIIDWDSIPDEHEGKTKGQIEDSEDDVVSTNSLDCPFCNKKMTSTPGRTLHVKAKHPDKFEEYRQMIHG